EVKQAGVTADELMKAKKMSLSHHLDALTTMRGQASDLGSNWLLMRNLNFSRDYLTAVQKVTLDDIRRVATKYLVDQNLTVASLNPKVRSAQNRKLQSQLRSPKFRNLSFPTVCV